jgi:hypothetical protein
MFGPLPRPGAASHKWSRGAVSIVGGAMPGATRLAAAAAKRGVNTAPQRYGGTYLQRLDARMAELRDRLPPDP